TVQIMSVSGEVTNVTCNGFANGSITASSDGLAPFNYAWDHGPTTATIDGLEPGTYSVTVTDFNGCTAEGSFDVTEPATLTATAQVNHATCNTSNGSATALPADGTGPYQYQWDIGGTDATISN